MIRTACILLCLLLPGLALAQAPAERARSSPDHPTVGLVLSGGGARGGAHIGALQALEELRVPIHVIAGTSIGAAVGGIYASGVPIDEVEEFVNNVDWQSAWLNATPRRLHSFRRKRDDDLFLVNYSPGWNSGEIELPIGVVQGQVIDLIMRRVTLPVAAISNFDDLAIPFRAVASDVATGEAVVLGSGDLGAAIRASMSVPAVLAPIEINGRLLVDGGIAMNLPVEVAREMGADAIIAVDITDVLSGREEIRSVVDVTGQLTVMLTRGGVDEQKALLGSGDVLLEPSFSDEISPVTFERMAETIDNGYRVVMENREAFSHLMLDEQAYAAYRANLPDPRRAELPSVDFLRLENDSLLADSVIEARLDDIVIGEPLEVDTLERALNRVYGLELFQNVRYDLIEENGSTGLEIDIDPRSWGPNYLQLGLQFSSSSDVDATFGLAASYLRTAINPLGGEARATFVVGDEPAFGADLYQPIGPLGLYFVEPSVTLQTSRFNLFDGDDLQAEARIREGTFEFAGGRELLTWGEWRTGIRTSFGESELRVGSSDVRPADDFRRGELFARLSADTLDNVAFPRSGVLATMEWRGSREEVLDADSDFDQLLVNAAYAKTWGRHTLLTTLRYDATISGRAPVNRSFRFGGFFDLSGLSQNQHFGQHVTRAGLSYYRRIGDLALFPAFAGVNLEAGNVWQTRSEISIDDARVGASLWAGVDTPIGPVYVGYGRADGGSDAFYVFLGRIF